MCWLPIRRVIFVLLFCSIAIGCSEESGETGQTTATNTGDSNSNDTQSDTTSLCGNAVPNEGEACDDGEENSDELSDACRTNCQEASCGDGVIDIRLNETCDDGNSIDDDACNNLCRLSSCGDGVLQPSEECDDGPDNSDDFIDACPTNCRRRRCGDGVRQPDETCDDGNIDADDYCSPNCIQIIGRCGDGVLQANETCDDGNKDDRDGCFSDCIIESGYTCRTAVPNVCTDINECEDNTDSCDANATCSNQEGKFSCACNSGYAGDDVTCTPNICPDGFITNGTDCIDIDECFNNTNNCSIYATCSNTVASYVCACKSGFLGDGVTCTDINECDTNNGGCLSNEICTNTFGSSGCRALQQNIPSEWSCDDNYYNANDGCDCNCSAHDPDCNIPSAVIYGCYVGQTCDLETSQCTGLAAGLATPTLISPPDRAQDQPTALITLDWNDVPNATTYRVFVASSLSTLSGLSNITQTCTDCLVNTTVSLSQYDLSDLTYSATMYWMVRASSPSGGSFNSNIYSFTTRTNPIICGDGLIRGSETCDDGNTDNGDGCSSICTVQPGYTCNTASPNVCALVNVVRIPETETSTTFEMGRPSSDAWGNSDEQPVHTVTLSAYYIDIYEVTAAQYKACVDAGGCTAAGAGKSATYNVSGKENHPINYINWTQASAYCTWVGKRLPTEAEWERAAKGPTHRRFPWSTSNADCPSSWGHGCAGSAWTSSTAKANCDASDCKDTYSATSPVGSFPSGVSPEGLHDMAGNVWEWTADWYGLYSTSPSTNPTGPTSGSTRVYRGGRFVSFAVYLRASYRLDDTPSISSDYGGVRCAKSAP